MKKLSLGVNNIDIDNISNYDNDVKYIFKFELDVVTDEMSEEIDNIMLSENVEDRKDEFIREFNKFAEKYDFEFRIIEVIDMLGPGGGWPDCICKTIPMTLKEYIDYINEYGMPDYIEVLEISDLVMLKEETIKNLLELELTYRKIEVNEECKDSILQSCAEYILMTYIEEDCNDIQECIIAIRDYVDDTLDNYPNFFKLGF